MSLPWRPRLVHGSTVIELELPQRPWVPVSRGVGGAEESAAGVVSAWEYRRDDILRLRLRVWEWEWMAVAAWITAGQRGETVSLNLSRLGVDAPVWLVSPRMGEDIEPTLTETPGLYEIEIAVRAVSGTSLYEWYYAEDGGENLAVNPGFEDDPPGVYWKKDSQLIEVVTDPAGAHSGRRYYRISHPSGMGTNAAAQIDELGDYYYWDVAPGDIVDFAVWVYRESGGSGYLGSWIDFLDASQTPINQAWGPDIETAGAWMLSQGIAIAPAGARYLRFGVVISAGEEGDTVGRFDDAALRIRRRS